MEGKPLIHFQHGLFLSGLMMLMLYGQVWAASEGVWMKDEKAPIFRLNVIQTHNLPPAMYGTWSIRASVLKSTAPTWLYSPAATEIWTLEKENDEITLTNIVTQAIASIQVDKVVGNTATFHHTATDSEERLKILETPTITVDGDHLSGINRQEITLYRNKLPVAMYELEVHLEGDRLAGAKVLFHDPEDTSNKPHFEVAPLQFQDR